MKKLTLAFATATMLFLFNPALLKADTEANKLSSTATVPARSTETEARELRLNEIKTMDRSTLNSSEKKELRSESRAIKSENRKAQSGNGGVYLSVGAIIIIILLLILIL